jgi:hypothetical protein
MILLLGLGGWLVADLWTLSRRVNYDVIFCKNEIRFANAVAQEPFPRGAAVLYVFMCVDTVRFLIPEDRDAQVIVSDFESMVSDRMSQPNQLWVYIHGAALDSEQKVTWLKETYPHSEIQRFVASGGSWFVRAMVRS